MSHTPTPWSASSGAIFAENRQEAVAATTIYRGFSKEEAHANAEYIVRAVNSHAELLAALEALLKVCDEELDPKRTPEMRDARLAIAKAKS